MVYIEKRAHEFRVLKHLDLSRPYLFCPNLRGSTWRYLRRLLRNVSSQPIREIIVGHVDESSTNHHDFSARILVPSLKEAAPYSSIVELMFFNCLLEDDNNDVKYAKNLARNELHRVGFQIDLLFSEVFRVDFGAAGVHEYCLMGGPNRFILNGLKKLYSSQPKEMEMIEGVFDQIDETWHARLASFVGVILWSKLKFNPELHEALIDDWTEQGQSQRRSRKNVNNSFYTLASTAMNAFARRPL